MTTRSIESPTKNPEEEAFLAQLNAALEPLELAGYRDHPETFPTLHVFGVPRSGTTLATQLIATHLNVGYIDHLIAAFWRAPTIGVRLSRKLLADRRPSSYESVFGRTEGIFEPHEFGYYWRHLLGYDDLADRDTSHAERIDWRRVRLSIVNITHAFALPVMFKSFWLSMHMASVLLVLPKTCFLRIRRDRIDTALSLLRMRRDFLGSPEAWASMKPREHSWLVTQSVPMQLAGQVFYLERMMDEQVRAVGGRNVLEIDYESLCEHPAVMLERASALLRENGAHLPRARPNVAAFELRRPSASADPTLVAAIRDAFAALETR